MEKEIWKDIPGYEGKYFVSNHGNIRNGSTYIKPLREEYLRVNLWKGNKYKRFYIHRLVATVFLGESNLHVNHKDGNKYNNHVDNLEWVSRSDNMKHAVKHLGHTNIEALKKIRRPVGQYTIEGIFIQRFESAYEGARSIDIHPSGITICCNGKRNKCAGYIWKYL